MSRAAIHFGHLIHVSAKGLESFSDGVLVVDAEGRIVEAGPAARAEPYSGLPRINHGGALLVPGLVDAHVHLPQLPFAGLGAEELLPWLQKYTFPMEARFLDSGFARGAAATFFRELSQCGTTTAAVWSTSSSAATHAAFEAAERWGGRAIVGKVWMERFGPAELLESWPEALRASEEMAERWHGVDSRLFFAVTPRFAITCSEESMRAAAELAQKRNLFIQTHLAESPGELAEVSRLFPQYRSYTDVYEKCGLLTDKSLLAHCIYLDDADVRAITQSCAVMVHCPTSNRYLQSGFFPFRLMQEQGVRLALGTDVAGGYDLSMLHEMREAVECSKCWNIQNRDRLRPVLSVEEAFRAATLGGAEALGLAHRVGNFAPGKEADFLVLDDRDVNTFSGLGMYQSPLERLARIVYRGRWPVVRTMISGREVFRRESGE